MSSDPLENPTFHNFSKVFLGYCSGDSFAGDVADPIAVNATSKFWFRGRSILDAAMATLLTEFGMNKASRVLVKGCSAGGMATFAHVDRLAAQIRAANPQALVLGSPGAGEILYLPSFIGGYTLDPALKWLFTTANMRTSINADCLAANAADEHMCFYPQVRLS